MSLQSTVATGSRKMRLRIDTDIQQTPQPLLHIPQPCESIGTRSVPGTPGTPGALFSATSSTSWPSPATPSSRAPWSPGVRSPVSESPIILRPSDFDPRQYTHTEPKTYAILSPIRRLSSSLRGLGGYQSLKDATNPHLMRLAATVIDSGLDDWSLVEDVLRGATSSGANAKSVLRSIVRGLMTGEGVQKLSAGRLWAILMKNANSFVLDQATQTDFLLDLERVINSSCIEMVVVDRVISVLATSIHDYSSHSGAEQFGPLWQRICARRVTDSTPLHPDDPLYHPGSLVRPSIDPTTRGDTTTIASPYYPPATEETSDERGLSLGDGSNPSGNPQLIPDVAASGPIKKVAAASKRQIMAIPKVVVEEVVDLPPPYSPSVMSQSDAGPSTLRVPAVVDTYPFAKGYANDIGLNIDIDSLESHPFAKGAFGDVRRASLRDGRQVAIKCLRFYTSAQDTGRHRLERKSLKEIQVWSFLDHDNVLPLLGLCIVNNELGMVSEFMPNGNIQDYVRENPAADRYYLAVNVCAGLVYLHEHPKRVVHGDLKAVNVVVDANGTPKLTDFGLAQMIRAEDSTERSSSSSVGGTARWMARELICPPSESLHAVCCKPNLTSDVYALGMTIYEIFTGMLPFVSRKNDAQVISAIMRGELPERIPGIFTDELWGLLLQCWQPDPQNRPPAREVLVALQSLSRLK